MAFKTRNLKNIIKWLSKGRSFGPYYLMLIKENINLKSKYFLKQATKLTPKDLAKFHDAIYYVLARLNFQRAKLPTYFEILHP